MNCQQYTTKYKAILHLLESHAPDLVYISPDGEHWTDKLKSEDPTGKGWTDLEDYYLLDLSLIMAGIDQAITSNK